MSVCTCGYDFADYDFSGTYAKSYPRDRMVEDTVECPDCSELNKILIGVCSVCLRVVQEDESGFDEDGNVVCFDCSEELDEEEDDDNEFDAEDC